MGDNMAAYGCSCNFLRISALIFSDFLHELRFNRHVKPIFWERIIVCPKWCYMTFLELTSTLFDFSLSKFFRFFLILYPMTDIKMWVKVTSIYLKKILIILKMEGMGHLLPPKLVLLRFSTNIFIRTLLMLWETFKRK